MSAHTPDEPPRDTAPERFVTTDPDFEPAYLRLHRTGELRRRAQAAIEGLSRCVVCPRCCGVDRLADQTSTCKTGRYAVVASHFPHHGEEDCLRGWMGSGTIFFSWCNLRCVFCQNYETSQSGEGLAVGPDELAVMMLQLQEVGCHNINLVTPEHVVPQVLEALVIAAEAGLHIPLVYNTSAYDSLDSLHLLDGVIDIYMPDFKIWEPEAAQRYLKAKDYPAVARVAIREMHRQVGDLVFDRSGLARRGLLVRHLVMPGRVAGSEAILRFLAEEISPDTYVNVMAQYRPAGKVGPGQYSEINRPLTANEYREALRAAAEVGLWRLDHRHRSS